MLSHVAFNSKQPITQRKNAIAIFLFILSRNLKSLLISFFLKFYLKLIMITWKIILGIVIHFKFSV